MRIIVTSDSHKRANYLLEIIEKHIETTDLFINLGDGEDDVDTALLLYPNIKIERVAGNCDWGSNLPLYKSITANGKKIFFSHGHPFYVKHGYQAIEEKAIAEKADICLFGHTHVPYTAYKDSIHYMNPGAVCNGDYGIIDIVDKGIICYNQKI